MASPAETVSDAQLKPSLKLVALSTPVLQGNQALLTVRTEAMKACAVTFARPKKKASSRSRVVLSGGYLTWRWRIARAAARGSWTARVTCTPSTPGSRKLALSRQIRVRGAARRGNPSLVKPGSLRAAVRPFPPELDNLQGGSKPGLEEGGRGSGCGPLPEVLDRTSTYCTGNCTWYVWHQRPEAALKSLGNAATWWDRVKLPKGATPSSGLSLGGARASEAATDMSRSSARSQMAPSPSRR